MTQDEQPADGSFGRVARSLAGVSARLLGWRPGEFWGATPAELAAALLPEGAPAGRPLSRAEMAALMAAEPQDGD